MPYRSADEPYTGRRRPGRRNTGREHAGRGSRLLIAGLVVAVGGLGVWVVAANTILKAQPTPLRDVAAALVAARDGAPPTLSSLTIASVGAVPDMPAPPVAVSPPPPAGAEAEPVAAIPAITAEPTPDTTSPPSGAPSAIAVAQPSRPAAAPADPGASAETADITAAPPPVTVLASASTHDVTGALGAPPLAAGLSDMADDGAAAPLDGAVPLPRTRPSVIGVPLPRPRPEIATEASSAPVMTLQPWEIERNQPL
ncbi:hypothetical protein CCR97_21720 [Rhodoplanes elegans]|uniref:Uncharacterized protein n=1 Tax=Rhodoplanes elegans TaxID=29408 RepID=A0A327KR65_9BRAD|nr:hypothetical protein [Rhodoplanes elegans]MBK5960802.1 hypothetical protein [Rhodoplanes elegans]RAI39845.1 hypothetical protein CH338_08110 [Rhodoplanes elegans]